MMVTVWQELLVFSVYVCSCLCSCTSSGVMMPQLQRFVWIIQTELSVFIFTPLLIQEFVQITRPRYSSPYSWPLSIFLAYQKQWEVRRKMNAIGWGGKTLEQVRSHLWLNAFPVTLLLMLSNDIIYWFFFHITGLWGCKSMLPSSLPKTGNTTVLL